VRRSLPKQKAVVFFDDGMHRHVPEPSTATIFERAGDHGDSSAGDSTIGQAQCFINLTTIREDLTYSAWSSYGSRLVHRQSFRQSLAACARFRGNVSIA
jgi:hypothetical protein